MMSIRDCGISYEIENHYAYVTHIKAMSLIHSSQKLLGKLSNNLEYCFSGLAYIENEFNMFHQANLIIRKSKQTTCLEKFHFLKETYDLRF